MTSGAAVERATLGRGDDPASTVGPSAAALAAQTALEARRAALGIVTRPALDQGQGVEAAALTARPSQADRAQKALEARRLELGINYRPPTVEGRAWSAWAAAGAVDNLQPCPVLSGNGKVEDLDGAAVAGHVGAQTLDQAAASPAGQADPRPRPRRAAGRSTAPGRAKVGHIDMGHAAASTGRPSAFPEDDQGQADGAALDHGGRVEADRRADLDGRAVKVRSSLASAFLASKHVAPVGRLWLLLQAWDTAGRGFYSLDQIYEAFSVEGSAWHVGGRRRLQQLIKAGAGTFWTLRDYRGGRHHGLQMTGPAGVAAALGLDRVARGRVTVPVADLLGGMHRANAALFAAVTALRHTRRGGPRPVTRRTLAGMTGRAASTQRTYSKTARIEARPNYVILPCGDVDAPGVFVLLDHLGQQGRAGRSHVARQMPNTYVAPLAAASRGRLRKINRRLNLVLSEARGYRPEVDYRRIYHDTATGAARAFGRNYHDDHYWPVGRTAAGAGLWHMVEAVNL